MQYHEGYLRSRDGCRLYYQGWEPEGPVRAGVLVVHGLGEHSGRYAATAAFLAAHGLAVLVPDLRGHGRSDGRRVHIRSFGEWVDDAAVARDALERRHPDRQAFLLGHSQGALIACDPRLADPRWFAGLVLTSPFFGIPGWRRPSPLVAHAARWLARLPFAVTFSHDSDPHLLSRDPAVVAAWREDPLVARRVSARWYTQVQRELSAAHRAAPHLALPALVLQAGADRVVDLEATRRWVAAAPADMVEYHELDGLFHEILNEPERLDVLRTIVLWIDARLRCDEDSPPDSGRVNQQ